MISQAATEKCLFFSKNSHQDAYQSIKMPYLLFPMNTQRVGCDQEYVGMCVLFNIMQGLHVLQTVEMYFVILPKQS